MKVAVVDCRITEKCEAALIDEGFDVIKLAPYPTVAKPVASHTDIIIFNHANTLIISKEYAKLYPDIYEKLKRLERFVNIILSDTVPTGDYPTDAVFNALAAGDKLFIKTDSASESIIEYAKSNNLKIVHTKQGYPKCTVLSFAGCAVTADTGMAKILKREGIKVFKISDSDISLYPYKYGFIGGCAGVYKKNIFFLGNIEKHPDFSIIREAAAAQGYTLKSLSDENLTDLGGILFFDDDIHNSCENRNEEQSQKTEEVVPRVK